MAFSISISRYVKAISSFQNQDAMCPYCGNVISTRNGNYFSCNFCEMHSERDQAAKLRADLHGLIITKNKLITGNSWDDAAKTTEQIITLESTPEALCSAATFYEAFSDHCWYGVNYDLGGYMEQNSVNREKSWVQLSRSKSLLYQAIKKCDDELRAAPEVNLAYVKLIAETRLGKLAEAKETLKMINATGGPSTLKDYANMVYYSHIGDAKNSITYIDASSSTELNAFYYFSKLLVKNERAEDAKKILEHLLPVMPMPSAKHLLLKIIGLKNNV